jgi:hypothetical protein
MADDIGNSPEGRWDALDVNAIIEAKSHDRYTTVNTIYLIVEERDHDKTIRVRNTTSRVHFVSAQPIFLKLAVRRDTKSVLGIIQPATSTSTFSGLLLLRPLIHAITIRACGSMRSTTFRTSGIGGDANVPVSGAVLELKLRDLHAREEIRARKGHNELKRVIGWCEVNKACGQCWEA